MRHILRLSLLVLFALPAYSQSNYASLSGSVFDPQQKVLPGCSVQLTSETTRALRSAVTNDSGILQSHCAGLRFRDADTKDVFGSLPINVSRSESQSRVVEYRGRCYFRSD